LGFNHANIPFYAPAAMRGLRGFVARVSSLFRFGTLLRALPAIAAWLFWLLTTGQ
jgi:hypothetical protein